MSTTDTRAMRQEFVAYWRTRYQYSPTHAFLDEFGNFCTPQDDPVHMGWEAWQAATEAAKTKQEVAELGKSSGEDSGCRMTGGICACRSGGSFGGCARDRAYCCTNEPPRPYKIVEAAKATGTAGELPPLPDFSVYRDNFRKELEHHCKEYGQACAEAARQPAPLVVKDLTDKEIDALAEPLINYESGDRISYYKVRAIVRAALAAATNRSQP